MQYECIGLMWLLSLFYFLENACVNRAFHFIMFRYHGDDRKRKAANVSIYFGSYFLFRCFRLFHCLFVWRLFVEPLAVTDFLGSIVPIELNKFIDRLQSAFRLSRQPLNGINLKTFQLCIFQK